MSFFSFTLAALYGKIFSVSFLYFSELALYEFKGGTKDGLFLCSTDISVSLLYPKKEKMQS